MFFELSNSFLSVRLSSQGAELHSVFSKVLDKEIIWQADEQVWPRHAPVLFPIVGRLKNDSYTYKGKSYSLTQHGFARDRTFTVVEISDAHILFELKEDEASMQHFPFEFRLQIRYSLEASSVSCHYSVYNPAGEDLYFSIGAHPGFICPLLGGEKFSDYRIQFRQYETAERCMLQGGLVSGATEPVIEGDVIPLQKNLFDKDAVVLKSLQSDQLRLSSSRYTLLFDWYNMPYFGIWTKTPCESFVCLEPWAGIADHLDATGKLEEKEGIICLGSHQHYDCGFSFSPLRTNAE